MMPSEEQEKLDRLKKAFLELKRKSRGCHPQFDCDLLADAQAEFIKALEKELA